MRHFLDTRIHPIDFPATAGTRFYLKREDEAGFAASGGKVRKLSSLIPFLQANEFREVAVIGSMHSNNVLALSQALLEAGLTPTLFLKEAHHSGPGNAFLTELLVPRDQWQLVSSAEWPSVEQLAQRYADGRAHKTFVLPEGSFCKAAFGGTLSLLPEIKRQEAALGLAFDHIFIDSGTGLSAAGLVLGEGEGPVVHVVHMALSAAEFDAVVEKCRPWANGRAGLPYRNWIPENARSFGSVNAGVLEDIRHFARKYGLLTDPIYSAKLIREALRIVEREKLKGNVLLIHTGGCSTLPGFYQKLKDR